MKLSYHDFIQAKSQSGGMSGFEPVWMPDFLFPFQRHLTDWAIRKGRAGLFEDCGLGKTVQELVFAENVARKTGGKVLILTPLAVAAQTHREAEKFGMDCQVSRDGKISSQVTVTNYERLHYFKTEDFAGVVCDESSVIKAMNGKTRAEVTEFLRPQKFRLLCTATAAPNDYVELGTTSEALGEMGQRDMITMFFKQETSKHDLGWGRTKYRMKGHAEVAFWKWICSWARACRRPSDIGYDDAGFALPPLVETEHVVRARTLPDGFLFDMPARDMHEEREERRRTITERCEEAARLVSASKRHSIVWCHLNDEGDLLEKLIPGAVQVSGSDSDEKKEESIEWFVNGKEKKRVLISKPKIMSFGLNFQHCSHVVTFSSHSYEQYYQSIRRCWRFGQTQQVNVDFIVTEGEKRIAENLQRKSDAADKMFTELVAHMNDAVAIDNRLKFTQEENIPSWLSSNNTSPTDTPCTMATVSK